MSGLRKYSPESPAESSCCADCSEELCKWASVNRGVYLCDDCASIHRQLGRHYSQIKHLTQSDWPNSQSVMLKQLVALGANKIWEHNLHDPATKSNKGYKAKPKPKDQIEAKEAYIKVTKFNITLSSRSCQFRVMPSSGHAKFKVMSKFCIPLCPLCF